MDIKVRDLKQTDKIENSDKLMILVDNDLNLVKNITKEEFLTNLISSTENNALIQETDGNFYVNTSEISDSITALDTKFTNKIGDLNNLTTENKTNLVSAINEAAQSGGGGSGNMVPYSYGMYMYLDYEMENACWLKSAGQYNSGTVYSGLYQWIRAERVKGWKQQYGWVYASGGTVWTLSATPAVGDAVYGYGPRKLNGYVTAIDGDSMTFHRLNETSDQNVTRDTTKDTSGYISVFSEVPVFTPSELTSTNWDYDFDYAWVINTANQTFRVPLKTKTAPLGATAPIKSDGVVPLWALSSNKSLEFPIMKGQAASTVKPLYLNTNNNPDTTVLFGSSTGLETDLSNADSPEGVYLYFYAGNVEENADLINMGEITNALANKADTTEVTALCMPDYAAGVNGVSAFNVWKTAIKDIFVTATTFNSSDIQACEVSVKDKNGNFIPSSSVNNNGQLSHLSVYSRNSGYGYTLMVSAFIPKGYSYAITGSGCTFKKCIEYPLKGAQ